MGVCFDSRSKNYKVMVGDKFYGMFYDKIAAMNMFNYVAKRQGCNEQDLYQLHPNQKMSIRETLNFKRFKNKNGKRQLFTVIDK